MIVINLLCITIIVVFIVDLSGAIDSLKSCISLLLTNGRSRKNDYRLKPIDCSLCTTFWVGLVYLICAHSFTIPYITLVCILSYLSQQIGFILLSCKDILTKIIQHIG